MDNDDYDEPENAQTRWGRAVILLLGAAVLIVIFIAFVSGNTPIKL